MPTQTQSRASQSHEPRLAAVLMRRVLLAVRIIVGPQEYAALLQEAGIAEYLDALPPETRAWSVPFSHYSALNQTIRQRYGLQGEALLARIGRALFFYSMNDQPTLLRTMLRGVRLLPPRARLKVVLGKIGDLVDSLLSIPTDYGVEETATGLAYCWRPCALCWGHAASQPQGHLFVAFFQSAVQWATGLQVTVQESQCIAQGHPWGRIEIEWEEKT